MRMRFLLAAMLTASLCGSAQEVEWEYYGTADFTDGWIVPYFTQLNPGECHWTVDVEKSRDGELYRLVDPYHRQEFTNLFNESPNTSERHDIVIDCTDRDYVVVGYQPLFEFAEGVYADGTRQTVWGQSRAAFLEETGRSRTVIRNAGLNCTFDGTLITIKECYIGFTSFAADGGKVWNSGAANSLIRFIPAGVEPVSADGSDNNCQPEYFNLQGMKTDHPAPGRIYIEKRGTEVRKVVF